MSCTKADKYFLILFVENFLVTLLAPRLNIQWGNNPYLKLKQASESSINNSSSSLPLLSAAAFALQMPGCKEAPH
jgi:ABC-type thiamine transport system ATPase subunit